VIRLERLVLAAALAEEYAGNHIDAGRALEASWSLGRAFASGPTTLSHLLSIGVEKLQAGVLRKMREPPLAWHGRLGADGPWDRMLEAVSKEGRRTESSGGLPTETVDSVLVKAVTAVTDALRKTSPCDLAGMSESDVWQPAADALAAEASQEKRALRDISAQIALPNLVSALRRAARTEVDRELTLKVLILRLEKSGTVDGRWPDKLVDATSAVCPSATYAYRSGGDGVELRFEGSIDAPTSGPTLPLAFRDKVSAPTPSRTPTPVPPPEPTPTPLTPAGGGGMIPGP